MFARTRLSGTRFHRPTRTRKAKVIPGPQCSKDVDVVDLNVVRVTAGFGQREFKSEIRASLLLRPEVNVRSTAGVEPSMSTTLRGLLPGGG